MTAYLKKIWLDVNDSYWFLPALSSIAALLLATLTLWMDRNGYAASVTDVSWLEPARPDGASNNPKAINALLCTKDVVVNVS